MSVEAILLALPPSSAPPSSGAPPGPAPPGGPPFHSALAEHWARTANAEGQQQQNAPQNGTADGPGSSPAHAEPRRAHGRAGDASNATSEAGTAAVASPPAAAPTPTSSSAPAAAEEGSTEAASTALLASAAALSPARSASSGGSGVSLAGEAGEGTTDAAGLTEATTEATTEPTTEAGGTAAGVTDAASGETPAIAEAPSAATTTDASTLAQELASSSASSAQGSGANPPPVAKPQTSADAPEVSNEPVPAAGTSTVVAAQTDTAPAPAAPPANVTSTAPPARARAQAPTTAASDVHVQTVGFHAAGEGSQEGETGSHEPPAAQTGLATSTTQSEALLEGAASSTSVLTAALGEPLSATAPAVSSSAFLAATAPSAGGAGVDLQQMIESIHATVELAARQGASQARIALQPRDLGEIRIHLSQTSDGLLARVTADSAAAAQTLAGGRSELQQSLSSLGVSLLRLDIGSSGQPQTGEREGGFAGRSERSSSGGAPEGGEDGGPEQIPATAAAGGLESGGLVDVLA